MVSFLYALLVVQQILLWGLIWAILGVSGLFFYLFWRLIRAIERYADAMEAQTETGTDDRTIDDESA